MRPKPEWVTKVESEPCKCVVCNYCNGSGTVYYDLSGHMHRHMMDDLDSPEPCEECSSGVVETCDRCTLLNDYDAETQV